MAIGEKEEEEEQEQEQGTNKNCNNRTEHDRTPDFAVKLSIWSSLPWQIFWGEADIFLNSQNFTFTTLYTDHPIYHQPAAGAPGGFLLIRLVAHRPHQVLHVFGQQGVNASDIAIQQMKMALLAAPRLAAPLLHGGAEGGEFLLGLPEQNGSRADLDSGWSRFRFSASMFVNGPPQEQ